MNKSHLDSRALFLGEALLTVRIEDWIAAESPEEINLAEDLMIAEIVTAATRSTEQLQVLKASCRRAEQRGSGPSEEQIQQMKSTARHLRSLLNLMSMLLRTDEPPPDLILDGGDQ